MSSSIVLAASLTLGVLAFTDALRKIIRIVRHNWSYIELSHNE